MDKIVTNLFWNGAPESLNTSYNWTTDEHGRCYVAMVLAHFSTHAERPTLCLLLNIPSTFVQAIGISSPAAQNVHTYTGN